MGDFDLVKLNVNTRNKKLFICRGTELCFEVLLFLVQIDTNGKVIVLKCNT